jgi:deoxyribonuclease-4
MPRFGAHLSIAGGPHRAALAAQELGCESLQIFTGSPQIWSVPPAPAKVIGLPSGTVSGKDAEPPRVKPLSAGEATEFRRTARRARLRPLVAHDSYLINLASPDDALFRRSVEAFVVELVRAERLGLHFLVTHPGAPGDAGEQFGLARVAAGLDEALGRCRGLRVRVLLETTAGQGSALGHRFEHLARILALVAEPQRYGVCFDTCHVFAAGYGLAPESEYQATMREFDRVIGLRRLQAFHVNDSLKPQGSRVDRHAAIGKGCLGLKPFRLLVNDRRFRHRPMILETPKEGTNGEAMDPVNLQTLRELVA